MNKKLYVCKECGGTHFVFNKPRKCTYCKRNFVFQEKIKVEIYQL